MPKSPSALGCQRCPRIDLYGLLNFFRDAGKIANYLRFLRVATWWAEQGKLCVPVVSARVGSVSVCGRRIQHGESEMCFFHFAVACAHFITNLS